MIILVVRHHGFYPKQAVVLCPERGDIIDDQFAILYFNGAVLFQFLQLASDTLSRGAYNLAQFIMGYTFNGSAPIRIYLPQAVPYSYDGAGQAL